MSTAYAASYDVRLNDNNEFIITNVSSVSNCYPIFAYDSYDYRVIVKTNVRQNKQRAQSKINGKNSKWC
jgi:hypothetical protein